MQNLHNNKQKTVPCRWCKRPTRMLSTKRCDSCWELESRIRADIDLAINMLIELTKGELDAFKHTK